MIRSCSNCAGRIRYSIEKHNLICDSCGSNFEVGSHKSEENLEHCEFNEYVCNSCGSKIMINDSEASTFCIYCGSSNVVFDRVTSENAPSFIIPFKITREQAAATVRNAVNISKMVPKEVKEFKDTQLTSVYVPYYVTYVEYDGSVVSSTTQVNGFGTLRVMTDASTKLDDDAMARIEPFNLDGAEEFDSDYLLGFHSNVPDLIPNTAIFRAKEKAIKEADILYTNEIINSRHYNPDKGSPISNDKGRRDTMEVYEEPTIIMVPVWFLTMNYNGETITFMVNGQTGKLTGKVPSDERRIRLIRNLIALPIFLFVAFLNLGLAQLIFYEHELKNALGLLISQIFGMAFPLFFTWLILNYKRKQVSEAEAASKDQMLSIFANRRQKGE